MQSFMEYLHESNVVDLVEALAPGEVWGLYNDKYVPCDAKTMKVLRGRYMGMVAKPIDKQNKTKTPLPAGQRWVKVGMSWVILDKTNRVVGGTKEYIGRVYKDGKLVKDTPEPKVSPDYHRQTPRTYNRDKQIYVGPYTRDPRLQKYWNDRGDGPEGMWHWSGGRMREIDEPED